MREHEGNALSRPATATAVRVASLEDAFEAVRRSGLRLSAARRILLEVLSAADRPLAAEAIASGLRGRHPQSDLASTYRNLETLERVGLVCHVHVGHGPGLYALSARGRREYLVCERCDAVRAVRPEMLDEVREIVRLRFGHEARFNHFPLGGLCAECAAASASAPSSVATAGETDVRA
jgi:Fur family transcriptional regulator, ferric uptake regulator